MIDDLDRKIVHALEGDFPLCARPFAAPATKLGISEAQLIERLRNMRESGIVTRFGPFFNAEKFGGGFCLCAMAVPPESWDAAVAIVNAQREVAHNYRREHQLNMWFVIAVEDSAEVERVAGRIAAATGLEVLRFPKEREYFLDMRASA